MWERLIEWTSLTKEDCIKLKIYSIIATVICLSVNPILFFLGLPMHTFWFSMGVALFSLSVAFHSCVIAYESKELGKESKKIAIDSENKMNITANVNFLRILNDMEDVRVMFNSGLYAKKYEIENLTWKTRYFVNMATEMMSEYKKDYIKEEHQDRSVRYFKTTLDCLFQKYKWSQIAPGQRSNIRITYEQILDNNYYQDKGTKKDLKEIFQKNMGMKENEDERTFISRLKLG